MKKICTTFLILATLTIHAQLKISTTGDNTIAPGQILQVNGSSTQVGTSFGTLSGPVFSVNNSGFVGIGTNQPGANLDIAWNGTSQSPRATIALKNTSGEGHHYYFNSEGTSSPLAGYFTLWDGTPGVNRMALVVSPNGNVGIGAGFSNSYPPTSQLHVDGAITANDIQGPSDRRFKKNIKPLENALDKVISLKGYTYEWRRDEFPEKNFKSRTDMGLIAQEVEKIYPEVVFTADDAMKSKSIDYTKLIPALVEAIKALQMEVEELKSQMPLQKR